MISDTSSFETEQPNHDPARIWSLYVFQVADRTAQQRALRALVDLGREGVTGLGTHRGSEYFVIVDCLTDSDKARVKGVVVTNDPGATLTFAGRKRQIARNP